MGLGDLPPRQKMINIMYLVLLALLAMNVSKEILNSFVIINEGLERTNKAFDQKNEYLLGEFGRKNALDPEKVYKYYNAAKQVRSLSKDIDNFVEELKTKLIAGVEKIPEETADTVDLGSVDSKDNYDLPTTILIGPDQTNPRTDEYSALDLKSRIENFNQTIGVYLNGVLPPSIVNDMDLTIPLEGLEENGVQVTWEVANFYHTPLAAIVTNLSRIQAEVKNVEADVLRALYSRISADDFSFDKLKVAVLPKKGTYITIGDTFKAEVLMSAYSTTQNPNLLVGDNLDSATMTVDNPDTAHVYYEDGIANYWTVPKTAGEYEWGGVLKVTKPNGDEMNYPFESVFTAAKPNLVVSPTKMNVFYRGLQNPISVAVPGVSSDKLNVSVSNASVQKSGDGLFEVSPGKGKICEVRVTAEISGNKTSFPAKEFRVKPVPPPTPEFLGQKGSFEMSKGQVASGDFLVAKLEDFLFDLKYKVTEFKMVVAVGGKQSVEVSRSNRITPSMKGIMQKMSSGQNIIFKDIVAQRVPGGRPEPLDGNLIIEIK